MLVVKGCVLVSKEMPKIFGSIGKRIKELRKELNWTQIELSEKVGVSSQVISNWERGYTSPNHDDISKLSQIFNVSSDTILFGYDVNEVTDFFKSNFLLNDKLAAYIEKNGEEFIIQLLDNQISLEYLLEEPGLNLTFRDTNISNEQKGKILAILEILLQK